jgi:hypothetical protein
MKELKPIIKRRFKCDFCNHIYARPGNCKAHEEECYKNPNRICNTCQNTGVEMHSTFDPVTLGVIPDGREEVCSACKIAKIAGGKSYIEEN